MSMQSKPNIVFFFADDQRFNTIAALGNPLIHTPVLDRLVEAGTAFSQAHIPGGTVGAVCMPSRAMLHTGRTLFRLERDGETIPRSHAMLGETLRRQGYRTFGTGKWHNGPEAYARSFTDGGEIFFGGMHDHWNVPACRFDPSGRYDQFRQVIADPFLSNKATTERCDHLHPGKHSTELFSECAAEWIRAYDDETPFFAYISYMAPHDPRSMPEPYRSMYRPEEIPLPKNFLPEHPFEYGVSSIRDEKLAESPRKSEEIRRHLAEYYGMISHLDQQIGVVIDALKTAGKYDDTILVFAGDNGLAVGQHGLMGKQSVYEHSVRVPLLLAGPGIPKKEIRDGFVTLSDLFPTLCELIGIDIPASVEGSSLVPQLLDPAAVQRDSLYFAYADRVRGVKHGRYKRIDYRTDEGRKHQLFELAKDPYEMENLNGRPEYAEIEGQLLEMMQRYSLESDDVLHPCGAVFWGG